MIRTHMKLGQLRCEATVQALVETVDQYGQSVQDWDATGDPVPCEIRTATGRDQVNADQATVILTHVVTMWYQPDLDKTRRLIVEGRVLNIDHIDDVDNRHIQHRVYCVEEVGVEP